MVLSDGDIVEELMSGSLTIEPFDVTNVEPASVDLTLGEDFKIALPAKSEPIDLHKPYNENIAWQAETGSVTIRPEQFVLATTAERVEIPDTLVATVLGRSSLGRLGISVHQTAGYIDPGFDGQITLELSNHGPVPVTLHAGDRICQIVFKELSSESMKPYGHEQSQYQNQSGATESRMNFQ